MNLSAGSSTLKIQNQSDTSATVLCERSSLTWEKKVKMQHDQGHNLPTHRNGKLQIKEVLDLIGKLYDVWSAAL